MSTSDMHILLTGGGGYVGMSLLPLLLNSGYGVTLLDPLYRGGLEPLLPFFRNSNFSLIKDDMCDEGVIENALTNVDAVIHMAAVVGYPACQREPDRTEKLNVAATEKLCRLAGNRPLIFTSTGSCYGVIKGGLCTENTPLNPVSLYGTSKVQGENLVLSIANGTVLRFATAYGLSPVMRIDLLLNHLTMMAVQSRKLSIYEPSARRTFIHVEDMARSILFTLNNYNRMAGEAWNVGTEEQNLTKREICLHLAKLIPDLELDFEAEGSDPDARDYAVSYEKIRSIGFETEVPLKEGMEELIRAYHFF
ncbi:MAG: NAD(P)-dependent oxidoreductase [Spirochaetales bacterium]|nr:NAD(P)-dependent oxidoreductase [Spirochaetales bacterium]